MSQARAKVLATYVAVPAAMLPEKPVGSVRLVCQSDTHGRVESGYREGRLHVPAGDIYIHAGDFSAHGTLEELRLFHDYVASLPHPQKVVIAGNHDITLQTDYYVRRGMNRFHYRFPQDPHLCRSIFTQSQKLIYLEDSGVELLGLRIWGSPWQPEFFDWAFNLERGAPLRERWNLIPTETDVLITHGPPFGFGDRCDHGLRVGCEDLLATVRDRVRPAVHVFGHIHEGFGPYRNEWTHFINASTCTIHYRPTNPCIVLDVLPSSQDGVM